jgi:sugar phosphate isomerase/epimerase
MNYAICNETFGGWDHAHICSFAAELGYRGLEIAPYTLAASVRDLSAGQRSELRRTAEANGLTIFGLHWLLAKTEGYHVTSPDTGVRQRTADYLGALAHCCRDLGGDVLVFGSPAQRRLLPGISHAQATDYALDTFSRAAPTLASTGVTLCLEPLTTAEVDFLTTCDETVALLDRLAHPSFALHLDVKAMSSEGTPVPELIRRHASRTRHFHANDPNKRGPGFGATDFVPIFQALRETGYSHWVSVEVFDYTPDPETIARESLQYMQRCARHA